MSIRWLIILSKGGEIKLISRDEREVVRPGESQSHTG